MVYVVTGPPSLLPLLSPPSVSSKCNVRDKAAASFQSQQQKKKNSEKVDHNFTVH